MNSLENESVLKSVFGFLNTSSVCWIFWLLDFAFYFCCSASEFFELGVLFSYQDLKFHRRIRCTALIYVPGPDNSSTEIIGAILERFNFLVKWFLHTVLCTVTELFTLGNKYGTVNGALLCLSVNS